MSKSHTHETAPETAPAEPVEAPADAPTLADLDAVYVFVTRAGIPVAARPPFPDSHEFTETDRAALNTAWFRDAIADIGADLTGEGVAANYSDNDKMSYATARLNGGGIVNGKTVEPFAWAPDGAMTLLEESIDRVRWDYMCWTGVFQGPYDDHKTAADLKDRRNARAAIREKLSERPGPFRGREGFGDGKTYGELVMAKSAEVLSARYAPKTRTKKVKSAELPT